MVKLRGVGPQMALIDSVYGNSYETGENGRKQHSRENTEAQVHVEDECKIDTHNGILGVGEVGKLQKVVYEGEAEGDEAQLGSSNNAVDDDLEVPLALRWGKPKYVSFKGVRSLKGDPGLLQILN
jgi:hypothetical protein